MLGLKDLLEKKNIEKKENTKIFFVEDRELNQIEELLVDIEGNKKLYDPVLLMEKATALGYWCEADYNDKSGGYVFEKVDIDSSTA